MTTNDTQGVATGDLQRNARPALLMTGLAGLLFIASIFLEGPELEDGASGAEVRKFYEANMSALELQVLGASVALVALVLFGVGLYSLVKAAMPSHSLLVPLTGVAGAMTAVWMWVSASVLLIPLVAADDSGRLSDYSDTTLPALDFVARLDETFGDLSTVPRGLLVLAVSLAIVRVRILPRWIGHFGLFVGAASMLGITGVVLGASMVVAWFVGLFGFLLWTIIVSVACLVRVVRQRSQTRNS